MAISIDKIWMTDREKDRQTKKRVYIFNIGIISISIIWELGGYIESLLDGGKMNNLSQLLQGGTILLYALYIPIAIAILQFFFSKKYIPQINIKTFLGRVFSINTHILLILVSIVAAILIDIESRLWIFFGIGLWIGSTIKIILDLRETTLFITSSDKAKYWFDFLEKTNAENFIKGIQDMFNMIPDETEKHLKIEDRRDNDIRNYTQWSYTEQENFINLIINRIDIYVIEKQYKDIFNILSILNKDQSILKIEFIYINPNFISYLFNLRYQFISNTSIDNVSKQINNRDTEKILLIIFQKALEQDITDTFIDELYKHFEEVGQNDRYLRYQTNLGRKIVGILFNVSQLEVITNTLEYIQEKDFNKNYFWLREVIYQIKEFWYNCKNSSMEVEKKMELDNIMVKIKTIINILFPTIDSDVFLQILELAFQNWNIKRYIEEIRLESNTKDFSKGSKILAQEKNNAINLAIEINLLNQQVGERIFSQIKELKEEYVENPEKQNSLNNLKKTIKAIKKKLDSHS